MKTIEEKKEKIKIIINAFAAARNIFIENRNRKFINDEELTNKLENNKNYYLSQILEVANLKNIVIISKKYNDKNGNRKFLFSVFDNNGNSLNSNFNFRKNKNNLLTYKSTFLDTFKSNNYLILDLTE